MLHLSHKIIFPKLKIWCSKMQPLTGNHRPDLLTSLMHMSLALRLPRKMHLCRSSSNVPCLPTHATWHLNVQEWSEHVVLLTFWLGNALRATTVYTFSTSQLPKVLRTWCALHILTWKCASRHNGVHFFVISTSKCAPKLRCFESFDLEVCFAPHRRAIFHLSSGQMAPHFSTLRRHKHKSLEKHSVSRLFYLFAHLHLLSSDSFSSLIFFLLFSSLTLHTSAFPSVHIVGSLTSKLPSNILVGLYPTTRT